MKQLMLLPLLCIGAVPSNKLPERNGNIYPVPNVLTFVQQESNSSQPQSGSAKMATAVFKSQEFCRAELKDFEFDARFAIVGASVYFSGTNFKNPEKGTINSSSLQPIRNLVQRCAPGSIIIFDEVKVKGPDNLLRTIPGISILLY